MNSLRMPKDLSYAIIIRISRLCNLIVTHSEKRRTAALLIGSKLASHSAQGGDSS